MTIREHADKAVDYAIRVALVSLVVAPVWFCLWWSIGFPPGGDVSELDATSARISQVLGIAGFVFISPAYACAVLLTWLHVPSDAPFGLAYLLAGVVSVPAVWGTVIYALVQLYRHFRVSRQTPNQAMQRTAGRSAF